MANRLRSKASHGWSKRTCFYFLILCIFYFHNSEICLSVLFLLLYFSFPFSHRLVWCVMRKRRKKRKIKKSRKKYKEIRDEENICLSFIIFTTFPTLTSHLLLWKISLQKMEEVCVEGKLVKIRKPNISFSLSQFLISIFIFQSLFAGLLETNPAAENRLGKWRLTEIGDQEIFNFLISIFCYVCLSLLLLILVSQAQT